MDPSLEVFVGKVLFSFILDIEPSFNISANLFIT